MPESAIDVVPPAPPTYPAFGPQWPGPGRTATPDVLTVATITAIAAAALLTWDRPGIGWFATAVVATIGITLVCVRRASREQPIMRTVWAVLALALLASGGLRAAGWLWALCLPTALICAALALAGGRTLRAHLLGVISVPIATVRALPWAIRGGAAIRGRTSSSAVRVVAALAVSALLLLVFGALLAGADKVFATLLDHILPTVDAGVITRWIVTFLLVGVGILGACFLAMRPPRFDNDAATPARRGLGRIEWGLPVGALVGLFAAFVAVEATVLFGGGDHVLGTAGLTYAEYARQGFWQLLAVTVLTLLVLAVAARVARRRTRADRAWLRLLLGLLATLAMVIVVSALSRMWAYEQAYGFSRLRLLVSVCEGWLGLLFVLVLLAGVRLRGGWLVRAVAVSAALVLVGIVALNPDLFIAEHNVSRFERSNRIDLTYLSTLSPDAVPALDRLPDELRECVLQDVDEELDRLGPDEARQWNLGRRSARAILADYRPPQGAQQSRCRELLHQGE